MPASMPLIGKIDEVDFGGPCPLAREDFLSSGYYRTDYNSEVIVLVDLLAADVNYGFKLNRRRFNVTILKSFNGIKVVNLYHLYYLWKKAEEDKEEFLVIETENDVKKYVLDTQAVLEAEASIVESHGLPGIASARLLSKMKSISHGGTSTPDEILALISPTLLLPTSEVTSAGTKRSIENRVGTEALKNKQRQKS
jgi:hypothetical protein